MDEAFFVINEREVLKPIMVANCVERMTLQAIPEGRQTLFGGERCVSVLISAGD